MWCRIIILIKSNDIKVSTPFFQLNSIFSGEEYKQLSKQRIIVKINLLIWHYNQSKYRKCREDLVSQVLGDDAIKLWINKIFNNH